MSSTDNLDDSSSKRINLVNDDKVRKYGQIVIAFILIGAMIGYLGYYTIILADDSFQQELAENMQVLLIMGVGAALAIFGLGRTVGRK